MTSKVYPDGKGTSYTYNSDGSVDNVAIPQVAGYNIQYGYDQLGRRTSMQLKNGTTPVSQTDYTYGPMSRLASVGNGSITASYARISGSSMINTTTLNNGTADVLTVDRNYDNLNRLTSITSTAAAESYTYQYNDRDQRIKCTMADGSYWVYKFDDLGQVTSGQKFLANGAAIPGHSFGYDFDTIGNRKTTAINGRTENYTSNDLNQYTEKTVPNTFSITGSASTDATVRILKKSDMSFRTPTMTGGTFSEAYSVDNSQGPVSEDW